MAYIESTKAPNGVCGGSLVAPGYVLTAAQVRLSCTVASTTSPPVLPLGMLKRLRSPSPPPGLQCVFKDGEAAAASDVKVWVDGKEYAVETVLVDLGE